MTADEPQFEMPQRVRSHPRSRAAAAQWRARWSQVLIVGVIGALIGAAIPSALRAVEEEVADSRAESLRTLAAEYLEVVADGDTAVATALVPLVPRHRAPQEAALATADRIRDHEVMQVRIDGDVGSVDVRYRVGGSDVQRSLLAQRTGDGWQITTSLAEPSIARIHQPTSAIQVGGAELGDSSASLYPGVYALERTDGPVFTTAGRLVVDGDPRTTGEIYASTEVAPQFVDQIRRLALVTVEACQARPGCSIGPSAGIASANDPFVQSAHAEGRLVDVVVPVAADLGVHAGWHQVIVRIALDEQGLPSSWLCAMPGEPGGALGPCGG